MNEPTFKSHPLECMIQKKRIQGFFQIQINRKIREITVSILSSTVVVVVVVLFVSFQACRIFYVTLDTRSKSKTYQESRMKTRKTDDN